jgi:hypothetical protein
VIDLPEPPASDGSLLVQTLLIDMCATDREIAEDDYGGPPLGEERRLRRGACLLGTNSACLDVPFSASSDARHAEGSGSRPAARW